MKTINKLLIKVFYITNLVLIVLYLYPGSIIGCYLFNDCSIQPYITVNFVISSNYSISSNHFYAFFALSTLGIFTYQNTKKIKFLITYLFLLSIVLELFHLIIPSRGFEWSDLFGNIFGLIFVIVVYEVKNRYA